MRNLTAMNTATVRDTRSFSSSLRTTDRLLCWLSNNFLLAFKLTWTLYSVRMERTRITDTGPIVWVRVIRTALYLANWKIYLQKNPETKLSYRWSEHSGFRISCLHVVLHVETFRGGKLEKYWNVDREAQEDNENWKGTIIARDEGRVALTRRVERTDQLAKVIPTLDRWAVICTAWEMAGSGVGDGVFHLCRTLPNCLASRSPMVRRVARDESEWSHDYHKPEEGDVDDQHRLNNHRRLSRMTWHENPPKLWSMSLLFRENYRWRLVCRTWHLSAGTTPTSLRCHRRRRRWAEASSRWRIGRTGLEQVIENKTSRRPRTVIVPALFVIRKSVQIDY